MLYAKDMDQHASFLSATLDLAAADRDDERVRLESPHFQLVVRRIISRLRRAHFQIGDPPETRWDTAVKLRGLRPDIEEVRAAATAHGAAVGPRRRGWNIPRMARVGRPRSRGQLIKLSEPRPRERPPGPRTPGRRRAAMKTIKIRRSTLPRAQSPARAAARLRELYPDAPSRSVRAREARGDDRGGRQRHRSLLATAPLPDGGRHRRDGEGGGERRRRRRPGSGGGAWPTPILPTRCCSWGSPDRVVGISVSRTSQRRCDVDDPGNLSSSIRRTRLVEVLGHLRPALPWGCRPPGRGALPGQLGLPGSLFGTECLAISLVLGLPMAWVARTTLARAPVAARRPKKPRKVLEEPSTGTVRSRVRWRAAWLLGTGVAVAAALAFLPPARHAWQRICSPSAPLLPVVKLAVLPFDNLTGDSAQEFFTDGLTDEE